MTAVSAGTAMVKMLYHGSAMETDKGMSVVFNNQLYMQL